MAKMNSYVKQYAKVCEQLGIKYEFYAPFKRGLLLTKANGKVAFIYKSSTSLNPHSSRIVSNDKKLTVYMLKKSNIPTTEQTNVTDLVSLKGFYSQNKQIVVKPHNSKGGNGVTMLPSHDDLAFAFQFAKKYSNTVLVEKYIPGNNYRFLVLNGKVLSVILRKPPIILGDGQSTVEQLITDLNTINSSANIPPVPRGKETKRVLAMQNLDFSSIPAAGKTIFVRLTANLSKGATAEDVTETVSEKHLTTAIHATAALGLNFAGVDIICEDISSESATAYVIEINASPGLKMHYYEEKGKNRDVAKDIITAIYNS